MIPEALIASMLTPEEFGVYYAVGSLKKARGQAVFFEIDPEFRHEDLPIEEGVQRCVLHEDGSPKRSVYISVYRALERMSLDAIQKLYLVTQDGRTLSLVAATAQPRFQEPYVPLPGGFVNVEYNDIEAIRAATTDKTCAVMLEPIQGEGGVNVPHEAYLEEVAQWCREKSILFMLDEIQTGVGRTGSLFAYEQCRVEPDIMTLAKAMGNGFPVGAMLATDKVATSFAPGSHASTFGGNPLAMTAGISVMEELLHGGVLDNCREMGVYFRKKLDELKATRAFIKEVRGRGLMLGMELSIEGADIVNGCMNKGLLINCT